MSAQEPVDRRPTPWASGFSLLETMVAAALLLVVFFGMTQVYVRGRTQVDFEEDRRKATAIGQARLDGIRRDYRYENLPDLTAQDTTYVVDNRSFVVSHQVLPDVPEPQATTLTLNVSWTASVAGAAVARQSSVTTILARGMPW